MGHVLVLLDEVHWSRQTTAPQSKLHNAGGGRGKKTWGSGHAHKRSTSMTNYRIVHSKLKSKHTMSKIRKHATYIYALKEFVRRWRFLPIITPCRYYFPHVKRKHIVYMYRWYIVLNIFMVLYIFSNSASKQTQLFPSPSAP